MIDAPGRAEERYLEEGSRLMDERDTIGGRSQPDRPRRRAVRTWSWLGAIIVVGLVCTLTAARQPATSAADPPPSSGSAGPAAVHALARLEPASGLVIVGARPGARIERIRVAAHDKVQPGAVLAILEGHAQAEAQLALALAQKARAEHQRAVKKQQLVLEREQADKLRAARLESAGRVFGAKQRWNEIAALYKQLMDDKSLPARDRFEIMLRNFEAESQNLRGEQEIKAFEVAQPLIGKQRELEDDELGDKGPDQDLLDRQVEAARVGVALAEVRAPRAGEVLELLAHEGEVSSGPLLLFGDTSAMVAVAEVFQADVLRVQVGDPATVQVLDRAEAGKVTAVGIVVGKNQLNSLDPRALQDRRVVKVTVQLDDPAAARRLISMEVDVAIRAGAAAGTSAAR